MVAAVSSFIFNRAVLPALSAVGASASVTTAAALATNVAVRGAAFLAVGALIRGLSPKPAVPEPQIPLRQSTPEAKSAFGRVRGGVAYLLYEEVDGDSVDVGALHYGRIGGIDQLYLHDDEISTGTGPLGAGFVLGDSQTGQYYQAVYVDTRDGVAGQSAFHRASTMVPGDVWTSAHRGEGCALIELVCLGPKKERVAKVYPRGLPVPSALYRGQYVYDWTNPAHDINDWTTWSGGDENPIRQLVTFMINPRDPDPAMPGRCLGMGEDFNETFANNLSRLTAAAQVCDQQVAKKGGGTEPRYSCNFEYFVGEDPADTIQRFLDACDGWMGEDGAGGLVLDAGAFSAPTVTVELDWITGYDIVRGEPDEARKNVIQGFWTDPDNLYARVEADRWFDATNIALTGKQRVLPAEFPQVHSHGQVRRLVKRVASRLTAPARGTLICDLNALKCLGERYLRLPAEFTEADELAGAAIEVDGFEIDLENDRVVIGFILADETIDAWDPDSEEGLAPPVGGGADLQPVPVIDSADITASVTTREVFGGDRSAHAQLVFDAPVKTYDLGAGVLLDSPRDDLVWVVRWRASSSGDAWDEAIIEGDVISGDQVAGYQVTLTTPALPRQALDVQVAAVGVAGARGDWSDSITVDVSAATAPQLAGPQNVAASAAIEATPQGVRRPALSVTFDPITDPQAQMVVIATKAVGAAQSTFAQIDMVEPRMGARKSWNVPVGETVDVGVRVWAKWREPSDWVVVPGVAIPDELGATNVGGLNRDAIEAADAAIAQAAADAQTAADNAQTAAADVQAGIDAGLDVIDASAGDFAAAMATLRDSFATGHASVDEAVAARLALIDNTASSLAGDIQAQVRDTRDALAIAARTAMAVQAQIEQSQVLEESVGNFSAGFSSRIAVILSEVAALTTQVDAWTAVNVTGDITAALNAEINARVSGDDAQASRSDSIETTANDAQQKADSILALTYSPSSAIALKFSGIEQNVGALQTQYTNIVNLENLGGSALLSMLESFEADLDPANPDSFRAAFDEARQIQIDDNAARTREIRDTRAEVARAALFIRSLRESTLFENEGALRLIEEANLAIAGNTASFQSILDMTLSPSSALVLRFSGIEAELDEEQSGSLAARVGANENIVLAPGTGLVDRTSALELDLDETEAGSLAAEVADHEYALFDGVAGLAGRMSTVETSLNPGSSGSLAAQVADLQSTRLADNTATAREIRELWAASARSNVGFQAQIEAIASENENTLRIIETAQVSADEANTRVDYILDLSIVDGTSLGNRLDSIEATANDAATQVSLDEAVQVQASDNAAVLRALRDVQAIAARTSIGFRAHLEARASSEEGILAEIETFRVETSKGLAQLETTKITAVDLEDAFAGFGLSLSSTFNIPTRFDAVEDELNPATPGSTANLAVNAATQADIDSSLVNWQLAINSSTRTIAGHLNHIEDGVDAVTIDLDQNYLTTAEANSAFTTMSEVETALATWQVSVNASTRTIADHLNHIEDTADATAADLAANYYTEAEADQAFVAESDLESALAAWQVSVNASTRTIADHLNHIEDQADNTAASLANDYLTASEANLAFMTESEVDNALASWAISVGATTQDIAAWITEHAAAITTLEGGGSAVYSLILDVNGHISGLYATNDGTTSNIVWATDEFIIGDGLDTTAPFRFDTGTGTFQAQNFEVDFALLRNVVIGAAEIEDASITSLKMANGSVGVELEADRRDNELWYSGTISNPTTTSQFRIFTEYTDWADVKPGDALRLELDYMIEATIGSFEWLLFEDELEFQFEYEDGSTAFYSPDSAVSKRRFGAADNTGGGPNISGVRPSNDHRSIARIKIGTPTSTPWMQAGSHSPLKRVRARYFIRTRGGNATTTCIYGGNYNGAAVRTGLKLVYAECLLTKTVSGPIQT